MVNNKFWKNKKVLVTGDTGFKGSWLSLWLTNLGSDVFGYSLKPELETCLFNKLLLINEIDSKFGDICDQISFEKRILEIQPDIIFHLAAQSLVQTSYNDPFNTWRTNVVGSVNLLEAIRKLNNKCAVVIITTDKVYENLDYKNAFHESDKLGGNDPYSSSKAACEIALFSWRKSFFQNSSKSDIRLASARAGNVIGGGDFAKNRIIPDLISGAKSNNIVKIRNINAIRPWQHVLEPLNGYLRLAELLFSSTNNIYQEAFNFGPLISSCKSVSELIDEINLYWKVNTILSLNEGFYPENQYLSLNIEKSKKILDWTPIWSFSESISRTVEWYKLESEGLNAKMLCLNDINQFEKNADINNI